jgi:hypothetical protein
LVAHRNSRLVRNIATLCEIPPLDKSCITWLDKRLTSQIHVFHPTKKLLTSALVPATFFKNSSRKDGLQQFLDGW